ncbi:TPA: hypothetical protein DEP94_03865 [Candidatus Nomurabacteria bacterium]|nr:hypothetical protein [Candidatus Nomurabacteria bacterium]
MKIQFLGIVLGAILDLVGLASLYYGTTVAIAEAASPNEGKGLALVALSLCTMFAAGRLLNFFAQGV